MQYCSILLIFHLFFFGDSKKSKFTISTFERKDTLTMKHLLFIMCNMLCVDDGCTVETIFLSSFFGGIFSRTIFFVTVFSLRSDTGFMLCLYVCRMDCTTTYDDYLRRLPTSYTCTKMLFVVREKKLHEKLRGKN